MSESSDPFDPVPAEDKVEEYQQTPAPEPDEERPIDEPVEDPEAPLDAHPDGADEERAAEEPQIEDPAEFPEV